jgi:hypothetical protein
VCADEGVKGRTVFTRGAVVESGSDFRHSESLSPSPNINPKKPRREKTALHEICREGTLDQLLQRLQTQQASHMRMSRYRVKYPINVVPKDEVMVCNEEGRLPLHVAVTNRHIVEEAGDSRHCTICLSTSLALIVCVEVMMKRVQCIRRQQDDA